MEIRRDVFQAIADPTRRAIIGLIAKQPVNVHTIAEEFNVSRQCISVHIKILNECGLLTIRNSGRERFCEARLEKLDEVHNWVEPYRKLWSGRFKALHSFLEQETLHAKTVAKKRQNATKKKKK